MSVALTAVSVLSVVNLALLFALIRKVRRLIDRVDQMPAVGPAALLPVGSKVPDFAAVTTTGEARSLADLTGARSAVGLFSPGCEPCRTQLPEFIDFAKALPGGPGQALAVVVGEGEAAAGFAAGVDKAVAVVIASRHGPLGAAFSVRGTPAFYLLGPDGRIEARGMVVRALASPVPA